MRCSKGLPGWADSAAWSSTSRASQPRDGYADMRIQLKALVAQRLFDTAAFYRVMNPAQNEAYRRAVEILADWEHKGESLLAPED